MAAPSARCSVIRVLQRFVLDQRHIAGENQDVLVPRDRLARALNGVAGSALLFLLDELHAGAGHRLAHPLRLVTDDRRRYLRSPQRSLRR